MYQHQDPSYAPSFLDDAARHPFGMASMAALGGLGGHGPAASGSAPAHGAGAFFGAGAAGPAAAAAAAGAARLAHSYAAASGLPAGAAATIDPNVLSLSAHFAADAKDDERMDSPAAPFALHGRDFRAADAAAAAAAAHAAAAARGPADPQQLLTPLAGSPLDAAADGAVSMQQQASFYSLSMPVHASSFGHVEPSSFLGSHPSSFGSFGQAPAVLTGSAEDDSKPSDALTEKRRRRRESHNAVERRRRDHINEKIQELSNLLPEFAGDAQNKPNKGVILRRSVDYIKHMQLFAAKQMERTMELESVLQRLIQERGISEAELGLSVPLGTPIELPNINGTTPEDVENDM